MGRGLAGEAAGVVQLCPIIREVRAWFGRRLKKFAARRRLQRCGDDVRLRFRACTRSPKGQMNVIKTKAIYRLGHGRQFIDAALVRSLPLLATWLPAVPKQIE